MDPVAPRDELAQLVLDVYVTREGYWTPDHGELEIPAGWEFLPSGDAFLTRTVKAGGTYWLSWQPRSRNRPHRRLQGLWAPREVIRAAETRAQQTAEKRASARDVAGRSRARHEEGYREQLQQAIVAFLDFAPPHADLAGRIAADASAHAAVVSSGRVGRTRVLSLEEKASLAARAHIRHRYTSYEDKLDAIPLDAWGEDELYREIKGAAHEAVDDFLDQHRQP